MATVQFSLIILVVRDRFHKNSETWPLGRLSANFRLLARKHVMTIMKNAFSFLFNILPPMLLYMIIYEPRPRLGERPRDIKEHHISMRKEILPLCGVSFFSPARSLPPCGVNITRCGVVLQTPEASFARWHKAGPMTLLSFPRLCSFCSDSGYGPFSPPEMASVVDVVVGNVVAVVVVYVFDDVRRPSPMLANC